MAANAVAAGAAIASAVDAGASPDRMRARTRTATASSPATRRRRRARRRRRRRTRSSDRVTAKSIGRVILAARDRVARQRHRRGEHEQPAPTERVRPPPRPPAPRVQGETRLASSGTRRRGSAPASGPCRPTATPGASSPTTKRHRERREARAPPRVRGRAKARREPERGTGTDDQPGAVEQGERLRLEAVRRACRPEVEAEHVAVRPDSAERMTRTAIAASPARPATTHCCAERRGRAPAPAGRAARQPRRSTPAGGAAARG